MAFVKRITQSKRKANATATQGVQKNQRSWKRACIDDEES
jgi:hypothetical protein